MVEVFRTNVEGEVASKNIIDQLLLRFPGNEINFDLDDCDRILRIEGENISPDSVIQLVTGNGYKCDILLD